MTKRLLYNWLAAILFIIAGLALLWYREVLM